ncbi:MAG TPA: hypothetical protein DCL43_03320 [Chitinophagaceae bacterium]|nr:hypothetical protein [Chitinophagaceae bacterium]
MKKQLLKLSAVALLAVGTSNIVHGQAADGQMNIVTTAVPFLRVPPDARAGGMAEMGIATTPDAASSFFNQAKLPFSTQKSGLAVTYTPWLRDITKDVSLIALSGFYQLDEEQTLSMGLRYFNLGSIDFVDFAGNSLGGSRPREFAIDFGYSRKVGNKNALGIALRYINSNLANGAVVNGVNYKAGNAVAADLTFFHNGLDDAGNGITYGVALSNLGSKINYTDNALTRDYIPANFGIGFAYHKAIDEENKIMIGVEMNKLLVPTPPVATQDPTADSAALADYRNQGVFGSWLKSFGGAPGGFSEEFKEIIWSVGAEYAYNNQFFARAGYHYENKMKGNRSYVTAGLGIRYNVFELNFSYIVPSGQGVTRNPLSNTIRFGLTFNLDEAGK